MKNEKLIKAVKDAFEKAMHEVVTQKEYEMIDYWTEHPEEALKFRPKKRIATIEIDVYVRYPYKYE